MRKQGLLFQKAGAEIFLVVIAKDRHCNSIVAEEILDGERSKKITTGGDSDGQTKCCSKLLRHQNRISIGDSDRRVQLGKINDCRNELIGYALNAMIPNLATYAQYRRLCRFNRVDLDRGVDGAEVLTDAHDRAPRANTSRESMRNETDPRELSK